jgi:hypothetical protein
VYLRARFYATGTGRFLSRDTWNGDVNRPMSFNRWGYVSENPVNRVDSSGLCYVDISGSQTWIPDSSDPCTPSLEENFTWWEGSTKQSPPEPSSITYLQDTQETYFTRSPESPGPGVDAPTTFLDYILALHDCLVFFEQFEWWNKFTRWGAGYGPDAKSVVYYYYGAEGIRTDDLRGVVISKVAIYAYTMVDDVVIKTEVSDRNRVVVYNRISPSIPESLTCNTDGSSHLYHYVPEIFVPETKDRYKITIKVLFRAQRLNFRGETVHEIDS